MCDSWEKKIIPEIPDDVQVSDGTHKKKWPNVSTARLIGALNCEQRPIFGSDFIDVLNYSMQNTSEKLKKIKNRPLVTIDFPSLALQ